MTAQGVQKTRLQGLMPGLDHEAALGVEIIEKEKIRIIENK